MTLLCTSLAYFTYRVLLPGVTTPPRIEPLPHVHRYLARRPAGRRAGAGAADVLTYLALAIVPLLAWLLYRTPLGLAVRAVGENPAAVEAQGLSVYAIRLGAVMAGSALMAIGGAFLTLSAFNAFFFGMVNGRGWICIALVVFALLAARQGAAGCDPVRRLRRLPDPPAAARRRCRALPAVPDAALSASASWP